MIEIDRKEGETFDCLNIINLSIIGFASMMIKDIFKKKYVG